ncbi:GlcG/HbpS family heme-binding protein [Clostridium intestinale]|uniref:Heme-binding protein n=1 Tax=Clostridium intestinale TaxID=36845 RepID=A0A7D6VTQ1_9CLOT|nr:heme-binding protein [Clostridium intestinale]QLY78912.1 heme-binding protein [Clostridium intestinale]
MINEDMVKKITSDLVSSLKPNKLTLDIAKKLLDKAENKAKEINVPVVIALVDEGGNLIAQHKMDDALLISVSLSLNKAYTSVATKMSTENLSELILPGKPLYTLENIKNISAVGGGIPIIISGSIVGAIGVSGGSVEEDILIAKTALEEI